MVERAETSNEVVEGNGSVSIDVELFEKLFDVSVFERFSLSLGREFVEEMASFGESFFVQVSVGILVEMMIEKSEFVSSTMQGFTKFFGAVF